MNKLFYIIADVERQKKRDNTSTREENLPLLWILSPTVSTAILDGFKASLSEKIGVREFIFSESILKL